MYIQNDSIRKNLTRKASEVFYVKMVKIQQLPSGQLVITIPKKIAEYEGIRKGMELEFKKHDQGFVLEIKKTKKGDGKNENK